ncbi:MAG: LON peptidase substrate-binding domain-containing protein [Hyphomicrobiales bacterium]|nr:LON peptidase substrate-binding domain-containing protein [Hyphomicrobiales bacterium]
MKLNRVYDRPSDLPGSMPVFPLAGALLLPRRPIQLNVFEPRYLTMLDDALSGERLIGMIQPRDGEEAEEPTPELCAIGCAGRIIQYAEVGDGRCYLTLMGVARFRVAREETTLTPYRIIRPDFADFADDFEEGFGESKVDRTSLVEALRIFAEAHDIKIDWDDIDKASNETLVNGLAMLSPFGAKEKQAMLEAADLKSRAEMLVAISQMEMARSADASNHLH